VSKGLLADVYRGFYERLGVPVAVKVLSPKAMAQGVNKDRFIREGQALAQLQHPNIIKIYNVGHEQGRYFIIMDWIQDGMNLRQLGQTRPLTPAQSLKVIERLCEALTYCHDKQLIHRDVKPANICLRRGGHPVLMDFSLMKDQSSDVQLTAPGTIMGTVNFMPPEQAQPGGAFGDVTERSDVYSLGGTLYWLLTGKPPFKGRTPMETIIKLMREDPTPPSQFNPSLPPIVNQLVMDCLSKKQDVRPTSAADLQARITDLFNNHRPELDAAQRPGVAEETGSGRQARATGRTSSATQPATGRMNPGGGSWGAQTAAAPVSARPGPLAQAGAGKQTPQPVAAAAQAVPGQAGPPPSGARPTAAPPQRPTSSRRPAAAPQQQHAPPPQQEHAPPPQREHAPPPQRAARPEPGDPGDDPGGFVPAMSTEAAAAGMLRLPDELQEDTPLHAKTKSPDKKRPLIYALLIAIIVICLGVSAYVVFFELGS
jgi:tRNA A-37 threonylcarbamoyl transferase component Bud32